MLQKLIIRNYAIIDFLTLEPDAHLNTVTGETGAGKSIILGALSLILGERADTSVLIHKEEKCVVEGHFDVHDNESFRQALRDAELDDEPVCIIRREISTSGKSRAFINDTPVNLTTLNNLSSKLVDLHQQFDHLAFEDDHFQMDVVDALAQNAALRTSYQQLYAHYRSLGSRLSQMRSRQDQFQKEADYKQFLFDELQSAAFQEEEVEHAALQLKQLSHAERIQSILQSSRYSLEEGEQPLVNELRRICQQLQGITDLMPEVSPLQERINSAYAELRDVASELDHLEGKVGLDPALMQQLQDRIDLGYKLFKKHGVTDTAALLTIQAQLEAELAETLNLQDAMAALEQELQQAAEQLDAAAASLSDRRKAIIPDLVARVNELLTLVGMPNARFDIAIQPAAQPGSLGADELQFLLDANKSGRFLPIHKAASGGEMSRIMLSIKSLTAKAMHLPTLIFDEVDTGISGEAARQVGMLLRDLAGYHQVICITHQPQVAARGSRHFFVYKHPDAQGRITTQVRVLRPDERVEAIARMIGGEQPGEAALQHARELVAC
jgi:DNA repair protein RecN (Recombination protein N)